jgi:hypothetical protein
MLEKPVRGKHSSLLQKPINYRQQKFYNIGPNTLAIFGKTWITILRSFIIWHNFGVTALSIMTLSIKTFSITTLRINRLFETLSLKDGGCLKLSFFLHQIQQFYQKNSLNFQNFFFFSNLTQPGKCDKFYFTFKFEVQMGVWIYQKFEKD